jgi:hypothetical protein
MGTQGVSLRVHLNCTPLEPDGKSRNRVGPATQKHPIHLDFYKFNYRTGQDFRPRNMR